MKPGGIYAIRCRANGKAYVGSAKNFSNRWLEHQSLLDLGRHFNKHLQNAWKLYGRDSFSFEILKELGPYDRKEYLLHEDKAMEELRSSGTALFNIAPAMGGDLGGEHTREYVEQRKRNMSAVGKKRLGVPPPTVKAVSVDGIVYESGAAAMRALGLHSRQVAKLRRGAV